MMAGLTNKIRVLEYIAEHGPCTSFEIENFCISNGMTGGNTYKNILINDGLVERIESDSMHDTNNGIRYYYVASQQWKGVTS